MGAGIGPAFGDSSRSARAREPTTRPLSASPRLPVPYLHRPRIDAILDTITQRRVALLVAPAGSGKTTAVAGWAAAHPALDVRWLVADGYELSLADLTSLLAGPALSRTVLVLDDAHRVPAAASRLVEELLDADTDAPPVLLLARHEPDQIPVARRLSGQVAELGYTDLQFQPEEARDLVLSHRPGIGDAQVGAILDQSRGWPAALVLMTQPLPRAEASPTARPTVSRQLLDYLTSEVLFETSPEVRQVLAAVCQEPYVTATQAVVVSGTPDAGYLLADLAGDGFLLQSTTTASNRSGEPAWLLHPLLTEVLRRRAAPGAPDWEVAVDAHRRAADQLGRAGEPRAALWHAMQTRSLPVQVAALRRYGIELLAKGQGDEVARALDLIPDSVRGNFVQMLALDALVLRGLGRYDDAKRAADVALAAGDESERSRIGRAPARDIEADLAILDVWLARCGWRHPEAAHARAARALGCRHFRGPSGADLDHGHDTSGIPPLRSAWLMLDLAALELWRDDVDGAAAHIAAAETYARETEFPRLWCSALSLRATLQLVHGSYQTAAHTAQTCLRALAERELEGYTAAARAYLVRGFARFHELDLEGAAEDLAAADKNSHDPFVPIYPVYRRILAANLMTATGDAPAARQLLAEDYTPAVLPRFAVRHLSIARVRAAGWMGDVPAIEAEASVLRDAGFRVEASYAHGLAVGLSGNPAAAISLYDRVLIADEPVAGNQPIAGPASNTAAAMAIARVAFLLRISTPDAVNRARHLLPDALNRLAPQRLLWLAAVGLMITPRFTELLEFEASRVGGHPLAESVVAALRRQPKHYLTVATIPATSTAHEAAASVGLTPRELEVLHALATGGSNATIASGLYLSENTVKTHLAALYRKLGVESRSDAISTARRLGLL